VGRVIIWELKTISTKPGWSLPTSKDSVKWQSGSLSWDCRKRNHLRPGGQDSPYLSALWFPLSPSFSCWEELNQVYSTLLKQIMFCQWFFWMKLREGNKSLAAQTQDRGGSRTQKFAIISTRGEKAKKWLLQKITRNWTFPKFLNGYNHMRRIYGLDGSDPESNLPVRLSFSGWV